MTLTTRVLTRDELIVLAGVMRLMMMADHEVTPEELQQISDTGRELGLPEALWEQIWEEASRELRSAESVREAASRLERVAAREAVYELLYHLADADSISDPEWDLLEWLDETWLAR